MIRNLTKVVRGSNIINCRLFAERSNQKLARFVSTSSNLSSKDNESEQGNKGKKSKRVKLYPSHLTSMEEIQQKIANNDFNNEEFYG